MLQRQAGPRCDVFQVVSSPCSPAASLQCHREAGALSVLLSRTAPVDVAHPSPELVVGEPVARALAQPHCCLLRGQVKLVAGRPGGPFGPSPCLLLRPGVPTRACSPSVSCRPPGPPAAALPCRCPSRGHRLLSTWFSRHKAGLRLRGSEMSAGELVVILQLLQEKPTSVSCLCK